MIILAAVKASTPAPRSVMDGKRSISFSTSELPRTMIDTHQRVGDHEGLHRGPEVGGAAAMRIAALAGHQQAVSI